MTQAAAPFQNWTPSGVPGQRFDPQYGSYYEYRVKKVLRSGGDYGLQFVGEGGYHFWLDRADVERAGVTPAKGDVVRIYQHAPFARVDGVTVNGTRVVWESQATHQAAAAAALAAAADLLARTARGRGGQGMGGEPDRGNGVV